MEILADHFLVFYRFSFLGTTCVASMFEVMDEASFPIVILDEARYACDEIFELPCK